jgi:hypothetical protein
VKRTLVRAAAGAVAVLGLACAASPAQVPLAGIRWRAPIHVTHTVRGHR